MKKLLVLLTLFPFILMGQWCGFDEYNKNLLSRSPQFFNPDTVDLITPYLIPVVVHILENDSGKAPIPVFDSDVHYVIECLNRDFNLENADTSILTDTLKDMPGNMRIRFILAETDPDGLSTTGITRTKTYVHDFGWSGKPIKFDSLGWKDAWDPKKYFNIWVGSLWPGLLGYSQFPGGQLETDGIVVTSDVFKEEPVSYTYYNKGRITAHEIGHSLSLRHPWGNGWACSDNMISDIPTQNGPNYNCPDTTFSLCQGDTTRDIVKHYMDYCGDTCMVMFTKGQVLNARRSIQQYRMGQVIVDTTTLSPVLGEESVIIYPTISENAVNIKIDREMKNVEVKLYSLGGKLVFRDKIYGCYYKLNISHLNSGLYYVNVYQDGVKILTKHLIKGKSQLLIKDILRHSEKE